MEREDPAFKLILGDDFNYKIFSYGNYLKPYSWDNFPNPFAEGGTVMANIDSVFNFGNYSRNTPFRQSDDDCGVAFLDISKKNFGATDYWLWRNSGNNVFYQSQLDINKLRTDINRRKAIPYTVKKESYIEDIGTRNCQIVGSIDPPLSFDDFYDQLVVIYAQPNSDFFIALPEDEGILPLVELLKGINEEVNIFRPITAPYPFLCGKTGAAVDPLAFEELDTLELPKKIKPMETIFYNLKQLSIPWRIPCH